MLEDPLDALLPTETEPMEPLELAPPVAPYADAEPEGV